MAQGGFLNRFIRSVERLADSLGNLFGRAPSPPPEEPPPPSRREREREERPPPRRPPPTPTGPDSYRRIWREQRGQGSYKQNLEVFHKIVDEVEPDESERRELWESYVRNINRNRRSDPYRRQSTLNPFWQDSGIAPDAMDWRRWRIAMGYTGDRRSRTP